MPSCWHDQVSESSSCVVACRDGMEKTLWIVVAPTGSSYIAKGIRVSNGAAAASDRRGALRPGKQCCRLGADTVDDCLEIGWRRCCIQSAPRYCLAFSSHWSTSVIIQPVRLPKAGTAGNMFCFCLFIYLFFNDSCRTNYLKIYQTDICQMLQVR